MCGSMAGHLLVAALLLGIGMDDFSIAPGMMFINIIYEGFSGLKF